MSKELRYELKLVCQDHQLAQARSWIRLHRAGLVTAYPPRRVNSLYLDTPDLGGLQGNLDGLAQRTKVRWRWYGEDVRGIRVYLERKEKDNLLHAKLRSRLPHAIDMTRPWRELLAAIREQASGDWKAVLMLASQPTLLVEYQREYYVTLDKTVRVTLDYDQRSYDQRFGLRPNLHTPLPARGRIVIEVKADQEHAERLGDVVTGFPVARDRNSKYALGLLDALEM